MSTIKYILFDAANTLIHKPLLWKNLQSSLTKFSYKVPDEILKRNHKLISECLQFPDRTSKEFYKAFNSELLYSLGISPSQELLDDIFASCSYLPWEKFSDTSVIDSLNLPIGILSNFNNSLKVTINKEFGELFKHVFISENYGVAKPNPDFYKIVVKETGFTPSEILYIGDSIKLDMEPAIKISLNTLLIDRDGLYPIYKNRITSLEQLTLYL
ncbi:MAG: HAD family hydrolase [Bacteroidetes bacterium]|nr:HAD family hydrolase [Bacteroidota bacterium]